MGSTSSSLVDCVQDGDTQRLKEQLAARLDDVREDEITQAQLHDELEDAVHAALSMEIVTPHQYQQLQIALELMLHTAPTTLQSTECNTAGWTAIHRACVTGNLSFVAFLFFRYADHIKIQRDAFGLLPVDLIPPELGAIDDSMVKTTSVKALPSTTHERIGLAIKWLRERKQLVEQDALHGYIRSHDNQTEDDDDHATNEAKHRSEPYFIAFEPSRDRLLTDVAGCVHQTHLPLRVRYRLPRSDATLHGYFQLIWRADSDPRSEEPHYENHIFLRDSADLDHPATMRDDLESNQREQRRLHDSEVANADVITGSVPVNVSHLAHDVVCHVLFVASDKAMMKREIVLSTEGVRLYYSDPLEIDHELTDYYEDQPYEYGADSDEGEGDGYVFHVGGEAFTHPSEKLAGLMFETIAEFEEFVKGLRGTAKRSIGSPEEEEPSGLKHDSVRLPDVLSNQDEVDTIDDYDTSAVPLSRQSESPEA